jgi:undecaprenyl-diphosphatase
LSEWLTVIILGVVEGITEFLPISSTGHLIVASALLNFRQELNVTFNIFIQIGAVVAVIAFYRVEILREIRSAPTDQRTRHFWLCLLIAFLPAAAIGFFMQDFITTHLYNPLVVAVSLIVGGIVMLGIERWRTANGHNAAGAANSTEEMKSITFRQALIVGVTQMIALVPGVSRSAASIIGGMASGMSRSAATEFSFFLAIPTLGGATVYELLHALDEIQPRDLALLIAGALVAGVVAWFVIRWLLRYVAQHSFAPFGYYRIFAGLLVLLLIAAGVITQGSR